MNTTPDIFETLLILLTLTGMTFVPETAIPFPVWPLMLGLGSLGLVLWRAVPRKELKEDDFAPLMAAALGLSLAVTTTLIHPRSWVPFGIAFGAMIVAGIAWSAWRATMRKE